MGKRVKGERFPNPPGKHLGSYDATLDKGMASYENAVGPSRGGKYRAPGPAKGNPQPGMGRYRAYSRNGEFIAGHGGY